jgi:putative tryptophan/tyrosine transport system substrate-binding protein
VNRYCTTLLLWLCLALSFALQASDKSILIIKSHENQFFNHSIEKLINETEQKVKFNIVTVETYKNFRQQYDPQIVITFGQRAAIQASQMEASIPIIHSYLTAFQLTGHGVHKKHYTVLLDQPLDRYIRFVKLLLPINNLGLIKTAAHQFDAKKLEAQEKASSIEINQYIFQPDDNPIISVRKVLRDNDALLSLPEPDVYNHQTLKGILLASYRLNKPVISYSPAHVKSGALAAIYTSPTQIGMQIADILNQLLSDQKNKVKPINYAKEFNISVNHQVAHSLDITLPTESEIKKKLLEAESL